MSKVGGTYTIKVSKNGKQWSRVLSFTPSAFTPTRIGVAPFFSNVGTFSVDYLDVT